jgi:hypothetical protein
LTFNGSQAVLEHMLQGRRVSILEAMLLFGVQNLPANIGRMRRAGHLVKSERVPMAKVINRINKYTVCKVPNNLPYKEIKVFEYWISR